MDNNEFAKKLEVRTRQFGVKIIKLCGMLPNTTKAGIVKRQIAKSGTSVGANYREANRARSKADFRSKIRICEGEASETQYWLEIIKDLKWIPESKSMQIYAEAGELLALFSTIGAKVNEK